jgi:hypothetical protein
LNLAASALPVSVSAAVLYALMAPDPQWPDFSGLTDHQVLQRDQNAAAVELDYVSE